MLNIKNKRGVSVLLALLVTFLWSTSFIIIKFGLTEIEPIMYAGLRYFLAFLVLVPFLFKSNYKKEVLSLSKKEISELVILGILFYALTQGTQFLGLFYLPAVLVSLILNLTPIVVLVFGILFLDEKIKRNQVVGTGIFFIGILIYFLPVDISKKEIIGIGIMLAGTVFNAASSVLGRKINKRERLSPLVITTISMGIGSVLMLSAGFTFYDFPAISTKTLILLVWLAVVNTAVAFTIWNYTLKHLQAFESSIINSTMLIQIALLAFLFLGEGLSTKKVIGMLLVAVGAVLVQLKSIKFFK